ncbi:Protein of unknown function [Anaerovibrio lipolyticus DSM 3074]|uniref:Nuclease n=2 Tax=Anaerovibrio lipolyticus TaxID=82374 RepID=A0A0B2JTF1_9FIRM|nr:DUF2800 domain-containing protein [Anaerovibrio lipolyticus]KHM51620.1 hypothetical protein NZ47_09570 [Anaerovibrio lipolyticus]SHI78571.1 Protein of unknown function [Anaerovibrio lipolyticus DSM 3074]
MPEIHAILSASASHRWLECTPSARLEADLPDKTSEYAEEGTKAHALAEKRLNKYLAGKNLKTKPKDVDGEMWEATGQYVDICIEKINEAKSASPDAEVHVEERLDFSPWVPEGFGTGDMVLVSDAYIEVIDLKYGKGVKVSAENNSQMMLYALGLYNSYGLLYGAEKVRMTIVQPRIDNLSTAEISVKDLLAWGESIKPVAQKAFKGEGERCAGEHCKFCKGKATCRKLAEWELEKVQEDLEPDDLTDIDVVDILLRADSIKKWLTALEEYALDKAINDGIEWPGMKVVEGRSNRKISDPDAARSILAQEGYSEDDFLKPRELKTITDLEKLMGKKQFAQVMKDIIVKPQDKPTLVANSDKREPMKLETAGADDLDDSLLND